MRRTLACCLLLAFALPSAAAEPAVFRFSKDVDRGTTQGEAILAIVLDSDVYAATRPGFPDIRIFDAKGKEVPYLLERATEARTHTVRQPCASRVISLKEHEDGIEVLVQLEDKTPDADGLSIFTPLSNYERRVRISGSRDGTTWTPLVADGLLFDYARYMDISNREVRLPKNNYRQFKITIAGIADTEASPFTELTRKYQGGAEAERVERSLLERRPFRMDRIEFWHERSKIVSERKKQAEYPVVEYHATDNATEKCTVIDVRTRREPLTEFTIQTSSRNFSRSASLEVPVLRRGRTEWDEIARARLTQVDFGGYHKQAMSISFSEHRDSQYRIVIYNEDNPSLVITGVRAQGNVYRAVFLVAAKDAYCLYYGSDDTEQPKYDAAVVLGPLRQSNSSTEVPLGKEVSNPAAGQASGCSVRWLLNNPVLLGAIVVVLVAVLGWALYSAVRRIDALPK